jgi:6-phosphogluconate dehydrogenase
MMWDSFMKKKSEIGMVGLGVMGRNLALNMADHGHSVAGYDKDLSRVEALQNETGDREIQGAETMEEFVGLLRTPRAVMMLVPAGPPVDAVIHDVLPYLEEGDLIIDGGNSHFLDTDLRAKKLTEKGIQYLGIGQSLPRGWNRGHPGCGIQSHRGRKRVGTYTLFPWAG